MDRAIDRHINRRDELLALTQCIVLASQTSQQYEDQRERREKKEGRERKSLFEFAFVS